MQKIRKILRAVSEKTALPTNQPTNQPTSYYQQHQFYRTWLTPVQQKIVKNCLRPESGPLSKSDVKRYSIKYLIKI